MPDGSGATRDEVDRAIEALTHADLFRLKQFAAWKVSGLGRGNCGRTWEDLLEEAILATLAGAANNGNGRRWSRNGTDFVGHLIGAMRSIASHWKRDSNKGEEVYLQSELVRGNGKKNGSSPMDDVPSNDSPLESNLMAREVLDRLSEQYPTDSAASRVVAGWKKDLTASAIMQSSNLTKSEYQRAVKQIRQSLLRWGVWPKLGGRRDPGRRR